MSLKKLQKEFQLLNNNSIENCSINQINNNLYLWECLLIGPENTPYQGGLYIIEIEFPIEYPFKSPKIKFKTRIYHCNINYNGKICLNILNNNWCPTISIRFIIETIIDLIKNPDLNNPLVPEIANLMETDYEKYEETAREWCIKYAT